MTLSFMEELRQNREALKHPPAKPDPLEPWRAKLRDVRGTFDGRGMEHIATTQIFDVLQLTEYERHVAGPKIATIMTGLGWTKHKVRQGGQSRVRGYGRPVITQARQPT